MTYPLAILPACTVSCTQNPAGKAPDTVDITSDAGTVRFQMAGGIGAS